MVTGKYICVYGTKKLILHTAEHSTGLHVTHSSVLIKISRNDFTISHLNTWNSLVCNFLTSCFILLLDKSISKDLHNYNCKISNANGNTSGVFPYKRSEFLRINHCFFHFLDNFVLFHKYPFSSTCVWFSSLWLLEVFKLFVRLLEGSDSAIFVNTYMGLVCRK